VTTESPNIAAESQAQGPGPRAAHRLPSGLVAAEPVRARGPLWPALVGLGLLLGAAGWSFAHHQQLAATVPTDESLAAAAAVMAKDVQPGDAAAVYPGWAAAQTWRLQAAWHAKGNNIADHFLQSHPPDPWDADGHKRLWLLTTHGWQAKLDQLNWPGKVLHQVDVGQGTGAVLLEVPPSTTLLDLRRQLGQGKMDLEQPGGTYAPCRFDGQQFRCGSDEWKDVRGAWNEVAGSRHPCLFIQSPADKLATRLTWTIPAPPAGTQLAEFRGRIGNRLWAVRSGNEGTPAKLRVRVGNREVAAVDVPTDDFHWHTFAAPLHNTDVGQPLVVEVRADKHAWRQVCLDARVMTDKPLAAPATAGGLGLFAAQAAAIAPAVPLPVAATPAEGSPGTPPPAAAAPAKR
jgi:hypothetical protein